MSDALVRQLRDRIDELEETVRQLRADFAPPVPFPVAWGLTRCERGVLAALYAARGPYVTKRGLYASGWGHDTDTDEKTVEIYVYKLRRKLGPHGIEILTLKGEGYCLSSPGRNAITCAIGGAPPPVPAALPSTNPRAWSEAEDAIVREGYAKGLTHASIGISLQAAGFRARSMSSLSQRGQFLGCPGKRQALWTRAEDRLIHEAVEQKLGITELRRQLAQSGFHRSRGAIEMRVLKLGLTQKRVNDWSMREIAILTAGLAAGKSHRKIQAELSSAGYERSLSAMSRAGQTRGLVPYSNPWTAAQHARLREGYAAKEPLHRIAKAVGRTPGAVARRAYLLGLGERSTRFIPPAAYGLAAE